MDKKRIKLVVSDFHLDRGRHFRDGTQNILEDFVYDREWAEFIEYYRSGVYADAEVELILNGDMLNLLQIDTYGIQTHLFTERSVMRAIERVAAGHPDFFAALKRFGGTPGHSIAYVVGNHDAGMLFPGAKRMFSQVVGHPVQFYDEYYQVDGIHIEHGQQYESFAAIDMRNPFITRGLPEPVLNLPWGSLFVAVLLPQIKQSRPHVDKVRPFSGFLRWVLLHDFFWGVKTGFQIAKFVWDTVLLRRRYQIRRGIGYTLKSLREISVYPNYDRIAFKILDDYDAIHTVIFGHTHILRYRQYREGKEYFNDGTWNETTNLALDDYGRQTRLTYAYIEYPHAVEGVPLKPKVRLKQWNGVWKPENEILV